MVYSGSFNQTFKGNKMNHFQNMIDTKAPVQAKLEAVWCSFEVLKAAGIDAPDTAFNVGQYHYIVRMIDNRCVLHVTDTTDGAEAFYDFQDAYAASQYFKGL